MSITLALNELMCQISSAIKTPQRCQLTPDLSKVMNIH